MTTSPHNPDIELPVLPDEPEGGRWARAHHVLLYCLAIGLVLWLLSGFYRIETGTVGLVERMGQIATAPGGNGPGAAVLVDPGSHYGLPWPLDIIHRIPSERSLTVDVADFNPQASANEAVKRAWRENRGIPNPVLDAWLDPYLITADLNILKAQMAVQYRISDAYAYFMSVSHGNSDDDTQILAQREIIVHQVAAHVLIQEIARTPIDLALKGGKADLEVRIKKAIQDEADQLNLGVLIAEVNLKTVTWPAAVDIPFNRVLEAEQRMPAVIAAAQQYANAQVVSAQTGEAGKLLSDARGEAAKTVQDARAQAERFQAIYEKYTQAPALTKLSLYSDAIRTILDNVSRVIYVPPNSPAPVIPIPEIDEKAQAAERNAANAAGNSMPGGAVSPGRGQ